VVHVKEGVSADDIHCRLAAVCGDAAPSCRTVFRWAMVPGKMGTPGSIAPQQCETAQQ
jgi:hypothetical protein